MKKIMIFAITTLSIIVLNAQPPQGGMGGGRPDGPPRGGQMGQRPSSNIEEKLILEVFPEIPNLTLEQREKVGSIITKEMKDVSKQLDKKRQLMPKRDEVISEQDMEKQRQKIEKVDKKIADVKEKSNKKIKKELTDEQYQIFLEKREEFKFKQHRERPRMGNDERPRPSFDNDEGNGPDMEF